MSVRDWQTTAAKVFLAGAFLVGIYLVFEYIIPAVFPLIAAFSISWVVWRVSCGIHKITGIPRRLCSFVLVTLMLMLLGWATVFVIRQLMAEATRLLSGLSQSDWGICQSLSFLEDIPTVYPVIKYSEEFADHVTPIISRGLEALTVYLGAALGKIIKATPNAFLGGVVTVLFIYYASMDLGRIGEVLNDVLPESIRRRADDVRRRLVGAVGRYMKAYAIIFALTFFEILAGLLILCPQYCFIGALGIALIDILPVLGAGLVLIPWGLICLLTGNVFRGLGLIVLYLAVTVIRQTVEPKIIGGSLGIHPLLTLTGVFVGYRLFGVGGMILAPIVICVVKEMRSIK